MRKLSIAIVIWLLAGAVSYGRDRLFIRANEPGQLHPEIQAPLQGEVSSKVKEFFEIQKKMFDIEKQAIQQDQELRQLAEQIRLLQKQLRERVEEKLKVNEEYQSLKQKKEEIRESFLKANVKRKDALRDLDKR